MKEIKNVKYIFLILLICGGIFLTISFFIYSNINNFIKNGEKITAKILSIETKEKKKNGKNEKIYIVNVEYFVNENRYVNSLGHYHIGMKEGQVITIRFLTNDPNEIMYEKNEFYLFGYSLA